MSSQVDSDSCADNSADLLRVLVALGLLALLAWFDRPEGAAPSPAASAGIVQDP